jgi:hypothetical protein|nr:extensin family protein [Kofleriaceae bacterium]
MRAAIVAVVLAGMASSAVAKDSKDGKHPKDAKSKHDKSARSSKKPKRESTAVGKDHKFKADNMPAGWQWPPSKAMLAQEKGCETKLDDAGVTWAAGKADGRIVDAVTLPDQQVDGVQFVGYASQPYVMDCQLALAWAKFAPTMYGLGVREVHFGSVYRWTKVRAFGKTENMLSRHSIGIAMDVVSFVDDTGREAIVGRDYKKGDALLLGIEHAVNASGLFRTLLTPKNDPRSHSDHFHVEAAIDFTPPDEIADTATSETPEQ